MRRAAKPAWLAGYLALVVLPLALALAVPGPRRGGLFELGSALGIVALAILGLQLALPARLRTTARALGADVAVRLHRRLADVLLALVGAHVLVVMLADPRRLALLRVAGAPWRAQAAVAATLCLLALAATSVARRRLRLSYAAWRGVHLALGAGALVLAVVHTAGVDRYLTHGPALVWLAAFTAACLAAVVELRLLRPRRLAREAYAVEAVTPERGGATTLRLSAQHHGGHRFEPGQFAWLRRLDGGALLVEHPFSYASSAADPRHPAFTIQAHAGFSRDVATIPLGTPVLLDGPYGSYRPEPRARRHVLLATGIGITPVASVLRTAADRGDRRPYLVVHGCRAECDLVLGDDLYALRRRLDLRVVHTLSRPSPRWPGERGRIDAALLDRHLPADLRATSFFVCGSQPVVETVVAALAELGVAPELVHAETFAHV